VLCALACELHSPGVGCLDLDKEAKPWLAHGYTPEGQDFDDPIHFVRGRFLIGAGPRLELLVANADASPVKATPPAAPKSIIRHPWPRASTKVSSSRAI
jgi:methylmalonyl-CoA/ethylmalonyl-CoA epimerase